MATPGPVADQDKSNANRLTTMLYSIVTWVGTAMSFLVLIDELRTWQVVFVHLYELAETNLPAMVWFLEIIHIVVESWRGALSWLFRAVSLNISQTAQAVLSLLFFLGLRTLSFIATIPSDTTYNSAIAHFQESINLIANTPGQIKSMLSEGPNIYNLRYVLFGLALYAAMITAIYLAWSGNWSEVWLAVVIIWLVPTQSLLFWAITIFMESEHRFSKKYNPWARNLVLFLGFATIFYVIDLVYSATLGHSDY